MQNKIRVLRVFRYVFPHHRTNNVYLEIVLACQVEGSFCQNGSKTHTTQFLRNFSMCQLKDISAQTVFKIRDFAVSFDFEPASRYLLQRLRLVAKAFPHDY